MEVVRRSRAFGVSQRAGPRTPRGRAAKLGSAWRLALYAGLPLISLGGHLYTAESRGIVAVNLHHAFLDAAAAVVHGRTPYPPLHSAIIGSGTAYVYPPLIAYLLTPLLLVSRGVAIWVGTAAMIALLVGALRILGVRDWRCYGLALLWLPTLSAVQTANLSIPLLFALAVCWRYRDRVRGALVVGAAVAAKVILWPVVVWLIATRRYRQAAIAIAAAGALVIVPWALLRFQGAATYWQLTREMERIMGPHSYAAATLLTRLSVTHRTAAAIAIGLAVLAFATAAARRGAEARSFSLAVLASILLSPVVWLHYFVMLAAPIAIYRPRLGPAWILPLAFWFCPTATANGAGTSGSAWQIALALSVAGLIAFAVRGDTLPAFR